ncbi:MAG TPA: class I adenylate-forming enzyme family protein [Chthoniobacteraceae bacterium]|nr:class I adenylate-forming enzyme family protein [Chthoniobacteraceae bacterium]
MIQPSPRNVLLLAWQNTWERRRNLPAILSTSGGTQRTFAQIETESRELAHLFARFAPGSVIGVQIGNSESWPALLLALFRAHLVPLPLGRHMEAPELRITLETCRVSALVRLENDALEVSTENTNPANALQWDAPVPQFLKLTSGTTSAPRAIRFQAAHLVADGENICATMGITEGDLNFGVIPFSHSYGFSNLLVPLLCRGVPLVASEDRMPRAILNDLVRTGATVFPGMPFFFQKFVELQNTPELPALRLCISAGAPLIPTTAEQFTQRFGCKIHSFYGSSECGGIAYDASPETHYEEGFVGTALKGVKLETRDEPGPITVRSAAVGDGYFPEANPAVLAEGRFVPSDLVEKTPRGLRLVGRASDVINIAGRKLNPVEVETRLAAFPGVRQVVVFGVPSSLRGEEAVACMVGDGIEASAVLRFCKGALSQWQMPRAIWVVPEIATNDHGKISRRVLAAEYLRTRELNGNGRPK